MTHGAWPFESDHVQRWAYWDNLFTKDECASIIALGNKQVLATAGVDAEDKTMLDVRDSKIAWVYPSEESQWVFQRVTSMIKSVNNDFFQFDLYGLVEGLQFTRYDAPSGRYVRHTDNLTHGFTRKLSVTIQLSADEDYDGGGLLLHYAKDPVKAPTDQGKAIVFPSFMLHEVEPVTKGTRYSLVCWVTGKPFK